MLTLAERFGFPVEIANMVRAFYKCRQMYFTVEGCTCPEPLHPLNGVLQGCCLSVLFALLLMTVWRQVVRQRCPAVKATVYIDDRNLWMTGRPTAIAKQLRIAFA